MPFFKVQSEYCKVLHAGIFQQWERLTPTSNDPTKTHLYQCKICQTLREGNALGPDRIKKD